MFVSGFNGAKKPSFAPKVFAPSIKFVPKPLQAEPEIVHNQQNVTSSNSFFDQVYLQNELYDYY
jgi:hypothetical protein